MSNVLAGPTLSAISYVHGERRPLSALGPTVGIDLTLPEHGLAHFCESDCEPWQLGARAARAVLEKSHERPGLLVYATENDRTTAESFARLVNALELEGISYVSVAGHTCGNLGPALEIASDVMQQRSCDSVLLVTADRADGGQRRMDNGLSVFSDGAAACMVKEEGDPHERGHWLVHAVITDYEASARSTAEDAIRSTVALGRSVMSSLVERTGRDRNDFRHIVFPNYRLSSQRFLASVLDFPADRISYGRVADLGHSFSADVLVTLDELAVGAAVDPGNHVLVSGRPPSVVATRRP